MIHEIEIYILLFFIYSFGGWLLESFGSIFNPKVKKFVNRGFLIGPYCPVYGVGVVLVSLLLKNYTTDIPVLFFLSILICGVLEYFTGYIMEKLFNARWWDYSQKKFNINGRVCLEMLVPFGIAATTILCIINPSLIKLINKLPNLAIHLITAILSIGYICDFVISFRIILSFKNEMYSSKDNTEEIVEKVKDKTEELGEKIKDKAEDKLMKTESDIRYYGRKYKLKLLRKARYTRNRLEEKIPVTLSELAKKLKIKQDELEEKIKDSKEQLNNHLKQKMVDYELKQKERILVSKKIVEDFKKKSLLKLRLMNAFPNLEIKENNKKQNKK